MCVQNLAGNGDEHAGIYWGVNSESTPVWCEERRNEAERKAELQCSQTGLHPSRRNLELGWPWEGSQASMSPHLLVISLGRER